MEFKLYCLYGVSTRAMLLAIKSVTYMENCLLTKGEITYQLSIRTKQVGNMAYILILFKQKQELLACITTRIACSRAVGAIWRIE